MFQKPAFGGATSSFGPFNTGASTSSPFGGFKSTTNTSAFGAAPAFGANATPQPAPGGGLFGATGATGGLFGATATPTTSAFGASTSTGFGFGQPNTSGGLFGTSNTTGGLFGSNQQQNTSAFGAKPSGFGFGSTATTGTTGGGLFGATPTTGGLFGQQNNTMSGGGLFGGTTGTFGQQQQQAGTAHVKYNPVLGTDVMIKAGTSQNINIKHHCITCMKEYETKSLEELRFEDYSAGRKGSTNASMFAGFQSQTEAKPLFGGSTFGQPATTSAPSVFGGGGFGATNTFSFGGGNQTAGTSNLFGANKPAFGAASTTGTGLFGAPSTQQAPAFGASTNAFGFGANTQNQSSNLFGAKPTTSGFGSTPASGSTGFGGFGANTGGSLFGNKPASTAAPAFGTTTPAFGGLSGGFGTSTSASGGLFGTNNTFGAKTAQPTFGFGSNQQTGGLGVGLGSSFQNKPQGSMFPSFSTATTSMFSGGAQNTQPLTFGGGTSQLGGGLGNGLLYGGSGLGNTSLGAFGGFGPQANNTLNANNLSGASAIGNVHEQILTLAARPYGDSPLFKDLLPDSTTTTEDVLKPTNPAAMKAVLDKSGYRVSSPTNIRLKVQPRPNAHNHDKKSLFDGLEESDASLDDKLSLKPSRKRLVLRPQQNRLSDVDVNTTNATNNYNNSNLSVEERIQNQSDAQDKPTSTTVELNKPDSVTSNIEHQPSGKQYDYEESIRGVNTDLEDSSEKHSSWLGSSKLPWNDSKEIPISSETTTPRLYPVLEDSLAERRASWLTTKPLRKPLSSNPDSVEHSVRELRADRKLLDKENIDSAVSEEENIAPAVKPPHPTGVKLTRPGYYTVPTLDEMIGYMRPDGTCVLPHLTIGRKNYGNVYFDSQMDVAGLDLDELVHFLNKEVIVYPDDFNKPAVGHGLNRRAVVTLDRVWPRDKTEKKPITDPDRLNKMDYEAKLRRVCDKHDTKFIEYRPQSGSWVFRVEHFSKYGLTDSDEDDDLPLDGMQQLVKQGLQKSAPILPKPPVMMQPMMGLGGMSSLVSDDTQFGLQHTTLNLLNGSSKAFEMDTTEDNTVGPSTIMYPDTSAKVTAFGVKSPTSELARLEHRSSHNVQLMKASLYADTEMEDDTSVSTEDQQVPSPKSMDTSVPLRPQTRLSDFTQDTQSVQITQEATMKPLMVQPHTVVLRYHRKVPPFKHTIAGRVEAAYISDMSVCRARHTRVGFGPRCHMVYVTTHDSITDLPPVSELSEMSKYVRGRETDDWSESVVARVSMADTDKRNNLHDVLIGQLDALLKHSEYIECGEGQCPQLVVQDHPGVRLRLLNKYMEGSRKCDNDNGVTFGVTGAYCYEVWRLCEALWASDLENDGIPGTTDLFIVNRNRRILEWLTSAVASDTDRDLGTPHPAEEEDETDTHSAVVWKLLLGGRVVEACKAANKAGDLNMAMLISQAASDAVFRSLVSRQLTLWSESGALSRVSKHRVYVLRLLAGTSGPQDGLAHVQWLRALNATARFIAPQVPSLDQIIAKYESFFRVHDEENEEQPDLTVVEDRSTGMQYPVPPYLTDHEPDAALKEQKLYSELMQIANTEKQSRRVLDLRYELLRARATNSRPKLQPSSYTPDPLDYTLCFLLGTWFGNPTRDCITGMADQLEACGEWHLAVQALMYHPDTAIRGALIRGVLSRNAPSRALTGACSLRLQLVDRLRVPVRWLRCAQAHRAKYEHLPAIEAEHLVGAGQWNAAHKVLLEELLPNCVLADELGSISHLLEKMDDAAKRNEISDWENGGQVLCHYLDVCNEIRDVVSNGADDLAVGAKLEGLSTRLAAGCRALAAISTAKPTLRAARAQMGTKLLQLAIAAGEPTGHLISLLKALKLPPDCRVKAQFRITNELAEQASESCIESTSTSPLSSHHRSIGVAKN